MRFSKKTVGYIRRVDFEIDQPDKETLFSVHVRFIFAAIASAFAAAGFMGIR